jgi:hypothetical protein
MNPTPTTLPYTNGVGYWYLTVKQARQAAAAAVVASTTRTETTNEEITEYDKV